MISRTWMKTTTTLTTLLLCGAAARADSIQMKASVHLPSNAKIITVGDLADLQGDEALRFHDTVVKTIESKGNELLVTVDDVRAALDKAGVHWGRIDLNGWRTTVRLTNALAEAPLAMTGAAIDGKTLRTSGESDLTPRQFQMIAAQIIDSKTTAGVIAAHLRKRLNVDAARVRLMFDERDRELLESTTDIYRVELEPMSASATNRVTVQARLWKNGFVASHKSISFNVDIQIAAAYSSRDARRGDVLSARDIETKQTWIGAGEFNDIITAETAIGRVARRNMKAGDMLRQSDLDRVTVIERGDLVQVRCLVGGVAIAMQAEARGAGSKGDIIEFRKPGERDTFVARVIGRNEAVIDLSK